MVARKTGTLLDRILRAVMYQPAVRRQITRRSHLLFFTLYFAEYLEFETAPFQHELFELSEREDWNLLALMAFRGSAKSTIMATSYPLWAILGVQQKKYVVIVTQTKGQAKQQMMNLRSILERESWLKTDLGPFKEDSPEWGSNTLFFPRLNARITVASLEQSLRGTRHGPYRPDLIIMDDVEDTRSVKTQEMREKTYNTIKGEVFPAGGPHTRYLIIGNLLHEDCLLLRMRREIEAGDLEGMWREYPIVSDDGVPVWPGKYSSVDAVEQERRRVGNKVIWQREYMLVLVPDSEQVIRPEWIQRYEKVPSTKSRDFRGMVLAIDPAISEKETADYTAVVTASIFGHGEDMCIYIHPYVVNKRMNYHNTKEYIKTLAQEINQGAPATVLVEDVAYQRALYEDLRQAGLAVETMKTGGLDKRARLSIAAAPMEAGKVYFPHHGTEELERQLTRFGIEKHDDLADAFSMLVRYALELPAPQAEPEVMVLP